MNVPRSNVVSFSFPLFRGENGIFIKNPQAKNNMMAYLEPFTIWAWLLTIIFIIVMPSCLYAFNKSCNEKTEFSLFEAYQHTFEALLYRNGILEYSARQSNKLILFRYVVLGQGLSPAWSPHFL